MMKLLVFYIALCCSGSLCDNLVELAEKLGANTLVQFVKDAGLAETLAHGGPFTVFGPSDEAFDNLPASVVEALKKDKTLLQQVLTFHIINGNVLSTTLTDERVVPTLNKEANIRFNIYPFKNKLLTATGSPVVLRDQRASNGIIHVISRVMYPLPLKNIVDTAVAVPDLKTLVKAVMAAKLVDTLSNKGPFTVFAPTNEAFTKLPPGTLNYLLKNVTALTEVLTYHVIPLTYYSAGLIDNLTPTTVEGKNVTIRVNTGGVMVNQAKVILPDVSVTNGVVHVIDSVLSPPKYFKR